MTAHGNQVDCHGESDESQKNRENNRLRGRARGYGASSIQFLAPAACDAKRKRKKRLLRQRSAQWRTTVTGRELELPRHAAETRVAAETVRNELQPNSNPISARPERIHDNKVRSAASKSRRSGPGVICAG